MLGSWLTLLAVTAAVLLVPALVALLRVSRHSHKADDSGTARRVRLAVGATLVGLGAVVVCALLGGGALASAAVAAVLGSAVGVWGRLCGGWRVRGVVVWGLGSTASLSFMTWLACRIVVSPGPVAGGLGVLWLVALWGLSHLRGPARVWVDARAGAGVDGLATTDALSAGAAARRTAPALAAVLVPAWTAVALTLSGVTSPDVPSGSRPGSSEEVASQDQGDPSETPSEDGTPGGKGVSASRTPAGALPATGTRARDVRSAMPTLEAGTTPPTPSDLSTAATSTAPTATEPLKTPGYAKDKSNRPSNAPSPGGGRPDR